jgi:hypothetical protein
MPSGIAGVGRLGEEATIGRGTDRRSGLRSERKVTHRRLCFLSRHRCASRSLIDYDSAFPAGTAFRPLIFHDDDEL